MNQAKERSDIQLKQIKDKSDKEEKEFLAFKKFNDSMIKQDKITGWFKIEQCLL